jgi:hypothetical protein
LQGALRMICLMYLKQIKASEGKRRPPADALPFKSPASGGSPMGSWLVGKVPHESFVLRGRFTHSRPLIRFWDLQEF